MLKNWRLPNDMWICVRVSERFADAIEFELCHKLKVGTYRSAVYYPIKEVTHYPVDIFMEAVDRLIYSYYNTHRRNR